MSEEGKKNKSFYNENGWANAGKTVSVVAVITPFLILFFVWVFAKKIDFEALGPVGDFFGGITVGLFNLASILLVLSTVKLQGEELKETRKEFKTTNETLLKQQTDNTFFNMISLHNDIVRTLNHEDTDSGKNYSGKDLLGKIENDISFWVKDTDLGSLEDDRVIKALLFNYERIYKNYENILGHYLRNLYRIVKFIHESSLSKEEKKNYIGILRAQLTMDELLIIFYNALSSRGKNFKDIIVEYNFFDDHLEAKPIYNRCAMFLKK
ncbi:putative phage abortive infection protein [Bacillus inaquosorum]|uniref:putative phage abortive infection protein n=1 Tax=Bacillus inaquosorum TaxID=483913 RepID=UPI002E1CDEB4|nr:putative phage abortive infection protein [Bacillus inaquosorum]